MSRDVGIGLARPALMLHVRAMSNHVWAVQPTGQSFEVRDLATNNEVIRPTVSRAAALSQAIAKVAGDGLRLVTVVVVDGNPLIILTRDY